MNDHYDNEVPPSTETLAEIEIEIMTSPEAIVENCITIAREDLRLLSGSRHRGLFAGAVVDLKAELTVLYALKNVILGTSN